MKKRNRGQKTAAAFLSFCLLTQPFSSGWCQVILANEDESTAAQQKDVRTVRPARTGALMFLHADSSDFENINALIQKMPQTLTVRTQDGSEMALAVQWNCPEKIGPAEGFYYQFEPVLEEGYSFESGQEDAAYIAVSFTGAQKSLQTRSVRMEARSVTSSANEATVYNFLRNNLGLNTAAACGVMANIHDESGFNPAAFNGNDSGGTQSFGICQWNNGAAAKDRYGQLRSWCQSNGYDYRSLNGQLNFMKHELESNSYFEYSRLRNSIPDTADGAAEASLLWSIKYEGVASSRYEPRKNLARNSYWPAYASPSQRDTEPPVISNVRVEKDADGYRIRCTVTDNVGVTRVLFPTWTLFNDQDDLAANWLTSNAVQGVLSGNEASFYVRRSDHNGEYGAYVTDIYAYDAAGNCTTTRQGVDLVEDTVRDLSQGTVSFSDQFTYTGEEIEPVPSAVRVGDELLTRGTDYRITGYANNIEPGTARITLTGAGQYSGTLTGTFTIQAASFDDVQVDPVDDRTYTGETILPNPVLRFNGRILDSSEYECVDTKESINAGAASFQINPRGSRFTGTKTVNFTILPAPLENVVFRGLEEEYPYPGEAVCPDPTVVVDGKELIKDRDYSISYIRNSAVGTATLIVTGKGNYTGTETRWFEIVENIPSQTDLSTLKLTGIHPKYLYSGQRIEPEVTLKQGNYQLVKDLDYRISYRSNVDPGIAQAVITGLGRFTGTITRQFLIVDSLIGNEDLADKQALMFVDFSYPSQQDPFSVEKQGLWKDFDLNLDGSLNEAEIRQMIADELDDLGIRTFTIKNEISINSTSPDQNNLIVGHVRIALPNPWTLSDSTFKMRFVDRQSGQMVGEKTFIWSELGPVFGNHNSLITAIPDSYAPEGYRIAPLTEGQRYYAGIFGTETFDVPVIRNSVSLTNISSGQVFGLKAAYSYTGQSVCPDFTVELNGQTLRENVDYEVEYRDNRIPGTAKVRITGIGAYEGLLEVPFQIVMDEEPEPQSISMHRLYNPNSGEHFYTAADNEKNFLVKTGWKYEGEGWRAPKESSTPVYRLYNENAGDHHYTLNAKEKDFLVGAGWKYEGVGWYSDDAQSVPLYRQYNPNAKAGSHNYTTSMNEHTFLTAHGWNDEGIAWYGMN